MAAIAKIATEYNIPGCSPCGRAQNHCLQVKAQKPLQYCKVISLQLIKINEKKGKKKK